MFFFGTKKINFKTYLCLICSISSTFVLAEEQQKYKFNTGFIVGAKENIDLQRFNKAAIDEGIYSIDVYTNDHWKGRYELDVTKLTNGDLGICYTPKMLVEFGIDPTKLNSKLSQDNAYCGSLEAWHKAPNIKDSFNPSTLKLMISMPQLYALSRSNGVVSPEFWDQGIPSANISYMSNYYNDHVSGGNRHDSSSAYLGINAGLSIRGWLLKHSGSLSRQSSGKKEWNSNQTYLQRAIPTIKSNALAGQFYTEGSLFDSIKLKGVKLATDDNMYPDGVTSYAPEINGIALSNALVTIRQDNNIIYQTSVPPGPFSLKDVYPGSYGTDLDVTVQEADGRETTFSVPYASVAQLLRPGFTHYQVAVGKSDIDGLKNDSTIIQGTIQRGLNNLFTLYSGITALDKYQAYQVGTAINTGFGALAFDVTQANTSFKKGTEKGRNYRLSLSRLFSQTNTNLLISASRAPTNHYYGVNDALQSFNDEKQDSLNRLAPQKNDLNVTINQNLPEGYGSFYLTGRVTSYWGESKTKQQIQQTYHNRLGNLSYSLSYMRVYSHYNDKKGIDNRFAINFSYPLDIFDKKTTLTSNTVFNDSTFGSTQAGLNGMLGNKGQSTYGINTSVARGGAKNIALNSSYRTSSTTFNVNYSQGESYRQFGVGANGSVVLHSDGITTTPNTSNTMVLVEAKGAKGASLPGSLNTRIDSSGYAIASYVKPYRTNIIDIDPKGSPEHIVFNNTSTQVIPYEGSITKVKFDTKVEKTRVFNVVRHDGSPLPFGSDVTNTNGESIGVVGQGGQVFINSEIDSTAFIKSNHGQCSFSFESNESDNKVCL